MVATRIYILPMTPGQIFCTETMEAAILPRLVLSPVPLSAGREARKVPWELLSEIIYIMGFFQFLSRTLWMNTTHFIVMTAILFSRMSPTLLVWPQKD